MSANSSATPKRDARRIYADYLKRKADEAPDSGAVYISAAEAEDISILLREAAP